MPFIFDVVPGRVVALPGAGVLSSLSGLAKQISLQEWDTDGGNGYATFKSIITRIGINQQENFQLQQSLDRLMYLYVFGDRPGQVLISGLCFDSRCPGDLVPGASLVQQFYNANRIAKRADPLILTLGSNISYACFLIGLSLDDADPVNRIVQFNMQLLLIPPDDLGSSAGGSASPRTVSTTSSTTATATSTTPGVQLTAQNNPDGTLDTTTISGEGNVFSTIQTLPNVDKAPQAIPMDGGDLPSSNTAALAATTDNAGVLAP